MEQWQATRHGGFRRTPTRESTTGGKSSSRPAREARAMRMADVEQTGNLAEDPTCIAQSRRRLGGSNPPPATRKTSQAPGYGADSSTGSNSAEKREDSARRLFRYFGREALGLPTCPYVIRWRVETPWGSVRLHHWLAPDDDRAKHDHPWSFVTFVLKGGYVDSSPEGDEHLKAPAVRYRPATHQHTVFPDDGGCWTIIVTGPKVRQWGFYVKDKFVKSYRYFYKYGHHPCD